MKVRKIDMMRLYAVSETPNENGLYDLVPFDIEEPDFNQEFEKEDIDEELNALVDCLYGGGKWIKVDETTDVESKEGFHYIQVGNDLVEVPDVLDKISADPDNSTTYLLVNRELTEGAWIVAERCTD